MRIFYALEFSIEDKERISYYRDLLEPQVEKGSFVSINNFHMTLEYIGEVSNVDDYKAVLEYLPKDEVSLNITKLGSFQKKNKRVYWLGIDDNNNLTELVDKLRVELSKNLKKNFGNYTPHITMARNVVGEDVMINVEEFTINVKSIALFESKRVDGILVYEPIKEKLLG